MVKMSKKQQRSSPTLPTEIIEEILSRLPVKYLMRFRCVSKQWLSLFMDPGFITKHLNRSTEKKLTHILVEHHNDLYILETESCTQMKKVQLFYKESASACLHVEASCDGLLCLSYESSHLQEVRLCNPITRENQVLPEDNCSTCYYSCFGLGFDPKIKEYKVVKVTYMKKKASIKIYTLGSHRWRRIHRSLPLKIPCQLRKASVTVSGAVHWVALPKVPSSLEPDESLLSFDVQREVFKEVPLPEFGTRKMNLSLCVGVLGGWLTVSANFITDSTQIWVMKEYGVKESWTHLFSISSVGMYGYYRHILPLRFWKDDEILLQRDSDLIFYNPVRKTEMKLGFPSIPCFSDYHQYFFNFYSFEESLVCPRVGRGGTSKS